MNAACCSPSLWMALLHLHLFLLFSVCFRVSNLDAKRVAHLSIGINYGRISDNIPPPQQAVALMQSIGVGKVKIFDADAQVLNALANTGLQVAIAVTNEELPTIASSQEASDTWVQTNVLAHYPSTQINFISVGNEVLSNEDSRTLWYQLVPAMQNIYTSLCKVGLGRNIKVSTSSALNTLSTSYPPSAGSFREDIATSVMQPMLQFLAYTRSYFFINVYPYLTWSANSQDIALDYAMLAANAEAVVQDGQLQYNDLLDAQLDAVASAMAKLGYGGVRLAISETGWPSAGDADEPGATIANAAAFNQRLVSKMLTYPPSGTPLRPRTYVPTYIFALFNENLKPGPLTERNWGLLYPNGTQVYAIDLTWRGGLPSLVTNAKEDVEYSNSSHGSSSKHRGGRRRWWCVSNPSAGPKALQEALDYACGSDAALCQGIQPGQPCFQPDTLASHASYAFHMYWHAGRGTCHFDGNAMFTRRNPSYGRCEYP